MSILAFLYSGTANSPDYSMSILASLFSGAVGGLVIMLIQNFLRNRKEQRDKEEELKGLIRIVETEMSSNEAMLEEALGVDLKTVSGAGRSPLIALRELGVADWDQTKVRLAQLASAAHFAQLSDYYKCAKDTLESAHRITASFTTPQAESVQNLARACKQASDTARATSRALLT